MRYFQTVWVARFGTLAGDSLQISCLPAEFRDKYTVLNTVLNICMVQCNKIFCLPAFLIFTRKIPRNTFAVRSDI